MKKIFAYYDSKGVFVYQAFKPSIVKLLYIKVPLIKALELIELPG